ncbi:YceD family protein [Paenibacillus alkalitolerans]|uniref:YceD family protein n=1 Tax=Paenibacillus alkalitolerans TaxID=2799335 RepID=UPI0018F6B53C|nr:YceD family protein [Paenibacillus alkalitolerans]
MILNLRELASKDGPVQLHGMLDMSELVSGRRDIRIEEPVKADLTALWDAGLAKVEGTLKAKLELVCSKCLKAFTEDIGYPVGEMFTQQRSIADKDEDVHLVHDERVDLVPHLKDSLLVQLPLAPSCDTACEGLCPVCGTDRNAQSCDCEQETIDPRLAGLKDFFNR